MILIDFPGEIVIFVLSSWNPKSNYLFSLGRLNLSGDFHFQTRGTFPDFAFSREGRESPLGDSVYTERRKFFGIDTKIDYFGNKEIQK